MAEGLDCHACTIGHAWGWQSLTTIAAYMMAPCLYTSWHATQHDRSSSQKLTWHIWSRALLRLLRKLRHPPSLPDWLLWCSIGLAKELRDDNQKLMTENRRVSDRCVPALMLLQTHATVTCKSMRQHAAAAAAATVSLLLLHAVVMVCTPPCSLVHSLHHVLHCPRSALSQPDGSRHHS